MYCAYVTRIHNLRKHTNADRLLCGECFGNTVIVDLGTDPDQLGVYFPTTVITLSERNTPRSLKESSTRERQSTMRSLDSLTTVRPS